MANYTIVPHGCPKCGYTNVASGEYTWAAPRYKQSIDVVAWTCRQCGFTFETPPRDASEPLQGWRPEQ